MEIKLTKDELETLIKLVYLGNWMANSWRTDDRIAAFDELQASLLATARASGLRELVDQDEGTEKPVPSAALDEALQATLDFYDDNVFWDQLIYRMADRDFLRRYGEEAADELDTDEGMQKEAPFLERYEKEFCANGLDRLEIRRDN
ncbi:MAG: hypothetical protein OEW05_02615 [Candidatus Aminicenantes bacterium]|nr:hypothetical protein [Candidatus Aminicenantes bacterium]